MDRLYVFLIRNDVWIYIICGLGLLWYLNELGRSQSRVRRAMFGLERETALRTRNKALLFVVLLSTVVAAVGYVNSEIRPTLPPDLLLPPTPTLGAGVATIPPTADTAASPQGTVSPTSPIAPTVTIAAQSSSPLTATLPLTSTTDLTVTLPAPAESGQPPATRPPSEPTLDARPGGCTPDAIITEPREGASVLGLLNVFGSANTTDFAYYEIEIRGPQTNDRWASLVGRRIMQPVVDGILAGNVNLSTWVSGEYDIRLTITGAGDQVTHQCQVSINLRTAAPGAEQ